MKRKEEGVGVIGRKVRGKMRGSKRRKGGRRGEWGGEWVKEIGGGGGWVDEGK